MASNQPPADPEPDKVIWIRAREEYLRALTQARAVCAQGSSDAVLHQCARGLLEHFHALRLLKIAVSQARGGQKARGGAQPPRQATIPVPYCPQCQGPMYDNRKDKPTASAPDFRCKKKNDCLAADGRPVAGWVDSKAEGGVRFSKLAERQGRTPVDSRGYDAETDADFSEDDDDLPF
jgi:hypothetical protein